MCQQGPGGLATLRRASSWPPRLLLETEVGQRLPVGVADDEAPPIHLGVGLVDGPGQREAALRHGPRPGVDMVAPFGASLHVSDRNGAALETAIAPYRTRPGLHWERSSASLGDVFIGLMAEARDNLE